MAESTDPRSVRRDPRLLALAEDSGYEIIGDIGAGGMGIVYRARDADGNDVAIKLLRHEISDDPRARDRLAREVAAQQRVRNDNIVRILDAELDSADAFVVTEFVPGPTLEDAVRDHGGLHPEAVRELGLVMGATLQDIHAAGVVHRDLKPSNVLLRGATEEDLLTYDPEGDGLDPVIIDFGIAIAAEESRLTSTGLVMGTAAYLDPEVVRTNHTGEAGDWWAWAALLAFAVTGREPFGTGRADLVFLRAERGELDAAGAPSELIAWLRTALHADPAQRPAPAQMLASLAELDLSHYEDPGQTQLLSAAGAAGSDTGSSGHDDPTEAIPIGGHPTQVLPALDAPAPNGAATEPLPRIQSPTAALPQHALAPSAPTEVIPQTGPPTMQMPVVAPAPQPHSPRGPGGPQEANRPSFGPAQYPVQRQDAVLAAPGLAQRPPQQHVASSPPMQHPGQLAAAPPMPHAGQWLPHPAPPRRPVLVWTGQVLLIAVAAIAPYLSFSLLLLLGALARTWERTHHAVVARRLRGSAGSAPVWGAGFAAPFRFLMGLLETALQALLPLILGLLVGIATDAAVTLVQGTPPPDSLAFVIAMAITVLITWVGLGSRTTRNGAHRLVDAAAPDAVWTTVVSGLLCLMLAAVVLTLLARQGAVDYFPFPSGPRLEDIGLWRR